MVRCARCRKIKDEEVNSLCFPCGKIYHASCLVRLISCKPRACCARDARVPDDEGTLTEVRRANSAQARLATRTESRSVALDALRSVTSGTPEELDVDGNPTLLVMADAAVPQNQLEQVIACMKKRFDAMESLVAETNRKLDANQATLATTVSEIGHIKEYISAGRPSTDLRVRGIPRSIPHDTPEALRGIFNSALDVIGAPQILEDVLEFRLFGDDPPPRQATGDLLVPSFSFVAVFKQPASRAFAIRQKRRHGEVLSSDLVPGSPTAEILFHELLPGPIYRFFQAAKKRGRERGYAVWCDDGRIYARKLTGSERIELVTEVDLNRLA
ncbi:hypothetical protein TKK_0017263 [Trichogramma kaykai]|uniref:Phorbol-ester/DAG-type domain-containing protein n=1 Tax=Trichogramma kaykai TaxID=54128 RepID=A0ABD2W2P2_9HYME